MPARLTNGFLDILRDRAMELANPNHDPESGKFTNSPGTAWKRSQNGQFAQLRPTDEIARYAHQPLRLSTEEFSTLKAEIHQKGFTEPLILQFNPKTNQIWLGDGNHRLQAAKELGIKDVPVIIVRSFGESEHGTTIIENPKKTGRLGSDPVSPKTVLPPARAVQSHQAPKPPKARIQPKPVNAVIPVSKNPGKTSPEVEDILDMLKFANDCHNESDGRFCETPSAPGHESHKTQEEWEAETDEYRGGHQPPSPRNSGRIDQMETGEFMPEDFVKNAHFYDHSGGTSKADKESAKVLKEIQGKPDALVSIYRGAPEGVTHINKGDWVAISKTYAQEHADAQSTEETPWVVYEIKVPARTIYNGGNDIVEWGYWGEDTPAKAANRGIRASSFSGTSGYIFLSDITARQFYRAELSTRVDAILFEFYNECHDKDDGRFCKDVGGTIVRVEQSTPSEQKKARQQASDKIANAPVPSKEAVATKRAKLEQIKKTGGRAGGDFKGKASDRRIRQKKLWEEFGGPERGYVTDPASGVRMHYSRDPKLNPKGYPVFSQGKIFTTRQGGGYTMPNLIPELIQSNQTRGDKPVRKENLD